MKKALVIAALTTMGAAGPSVQNLTVRPATWKFLGSIAGWNIRVDTSSLQKSDKFIEATYWMEFNDKPKCYPSSQDCKGKVLHSYETYVMNCNGTAVLTAINMVFDKSSEGSPPPPVPTSVRFAPDSLLAMGEKEICKR